MMKIFLFLYLSIVYAFSDKNATVTICREDKYDRCTCEVKWDEEKIPYLSIECRDWNELTTTNVELPRRVFQTYDIEYIELLFENNGIQHIPSPAISDQLSTKLRSLTITCDNMCEISAGAFDNLPKLEALSISGGLEDGVLKPGWLTADLGESLLNLILIGNEISQILPNTFIHIIKLQSLDLELNKIKTISDDAFVGLNNLSELILSNNELSKIPNALKSLKNLQKISFSFNQIDQINDENFKNLENIVHLDIGNNKLTEVFPALNRLAKLLYLDISGNNFLNIEHHSFNQLIRLETLNLQNSRIEHIPPGLFKNLHNLVNLNLNNNNIKIIKETFLGLEKLRTLDLSYCGLINIPSCSNLPSLEKLNLRFNRISQLESDSFQGLNTLFSLDISANKLKEIDVNAFRGLKSLKEIDMGSTDLMEIPFKALSKLLNLKSLVLNSNNITRIPRGSFYGLNQLTWLGLSGNQIEKVESQAFIGLKNLITLNIEKSKVKYIDNNAFDNLEELNMLYLNDNEGLKFANRAFGTNALENLEKLFLHDCQIRSLPGTLIQSLPNLWYLFLSGNAFNSIPMTIRNIRQIYSLSLSKNQIAQLESNIFNNSKIYDLVINRMPNLTSIDDCAFCGLTVWSIQLENNKNLTSIHDNAFGFANNSLTKTRKIRKISLTYSSIISLGQNLLPWKQLDSIDITGNPANCNPEMDWLFRDPNLNWADGRQNRCLDVRCKQYSFYTPCQSTTTITQYLTTASSIPEQKTQASLV